MPKKRAKKKVAATEGRGWFGIGQRTKTLRKKEREGRGTLPKFDGRIGKVRPAVGSGGGTN